MLPAGARLRHRPEFAATIRKGARRTGRSSLLVVHLVAPAEPLARDARSRVGFVVARAVGNAVVRNRVRRRLRHLMITRLAELPAGSDLVVRALPGSAGASSAALADDLDQAVRAALALRTNGAAAEAASYAAAEAS